MVILLVCIEFCLFKLVLVYVIPAYKKLSIIYSFSEKGFTDHQTKKDYNWEDFDSFRSLDALDIVDFRRQLKFTLKNNLGEVDVYQGFLSNESYRQICLHIHKYAPKNLTRQVHIPDRVPVMPKFLIILSLILAVLYLYLRLFPYLQDI